MIKNEENMTNLQDEKTRVTVGDSETHTKKVVIGMASRNLTETSMGDVLQKERNVRPTHKPI